MLSLRCVVASLFPSYDLRMLPSSSLPPAQHTYIHTCTSTDLHRRGDTQTTMVKGSSRAKKRLGQGSSRLQAEGVGESKGQEGPADSGGDREHAKGGPSGELSLLKKRVLQKKKLARKHSGLSAKGKRQAPRGEEGSDDPNRSGAATVERSARKKLTAIRAANTSSVKARARQAVASAGEALRKRRTRPERGGASSRMALVHEELSLFDRVLSVPAFVEDPLGAVAEHLLSTMEMLQPQTPDVGRAARP